MISLITILCLVVALGSIALVNTIAYSLNKKWSVKISDIITTVYAPLIFSILNTYKKFRFVGYPDHKDELPEQYLILSNHQSLLDIPVYMKFLWKVPLRFVTKKELGHHVPLVSAMLKAHEHALVPRTGSPAEAMRVLDKFAIRVQKNKWIPVIFPEGTRSKDGNLGTFYAAGFRRILDRAPMPVAVCALDGGWKISSLDGIARHLAHGTYRVKILKVYPAPQGKKEQVAILDEARVLIQEQLDQWRAEDMEAGKR
ncbi:MAG: 1-acyl-sn-glycerol-3-phosphate acyltransferase [Spirochaetaceae bacterium]|jgi:1-acyl-sn-glycerol-3-phosphate acyltransferase|nr:1-acyl-sn-glycerol-3-phosphate acyltransferase [Spirochaetaceae bacterium]